ncbi:MAG: DUF3604 domain-containing protein [Halioglobus sp.]
MSIIKKMPIRKLALGTLLLAVLAGLFLHLGARGTLGKHQGPGSVNTTSVPQNILAEREASQRTVASKRGDPSSSKQILFGDFHTHTTFSNDAYMASLPMIGGLGTTPPADACDYARYCSALDFWSINDHAVSLDQQRWQETKDSIRACQASAERTHPDLISFIGFEWTQANPLSGAQHYGHKNVIYRDLEDEQVAARPIYAATDTGLGSLNLPYAIRALLPWARWKDRQAYYDFNLYLQEMEDQTDCPADMPSSDLDISCKEGAENPAVLYRKLREAGHESLVIPHGNAWGLYAPVDTSWDKQLNGAMHDQGLQTMIEVFSGHGNSEEYRSFEHVAYDDQGMPYCPEESADFLPRCVQVGNIMRARCLASGADPAHCQARASEAMQMAAESPVPLYTVPGFNLEQWLDAGQCKDCFSPAYNYIPKGSAQYALALGNFDVPGTIKRFRFGMMAASDNHTARPGTGYKERDRRMLIEGMSMDDAQFRALRRQESIDSMSEPRELDRQNMTMAAAITHIERQDPFFSTGGLMAVHSEQRSRVGIWDAIGRKEVYGTSGDRILLWFDLLNPLAEDDSQIAAMGSEVAMQHNPSFRIRAVGARKQNPGCPDHASQALGDQRLEQLCNNECFNPSDQRKLISRIEVIRIKPQLTREEDVSALIEDVWLSHECPRDESGCEFEFTDAEFSGSARETLYYVRAIQEPSEAINGGQLRCEYDDQGKCLSVNFCSSSSLDTSRNDDCLAPVEERAWSSPIFIDFEKGPTQ